jgi:hypothetical protein
MTNTASDTPSPQTRRASATPLALRVLNAALTLPGGLAAWSSAAAQVPRLDRTLEIGCEDCGDSRQFASIWDVAVTDAGEPGTALVAVSWSW